MKSKKRKRTDLENENLLEDDEDYEIEIENEETWNTQQESQKSIEKYQVCYSSSLNHSKQINVICVNNFIIFSCNYFSYLISINVNSFLFAVF